MDPRNPSYPVSVEEGGLKLYVMESKGLCYTFAGLVEVGHRVWTTISAALVGGESPTRALELGVEGAGSPADLQAFVAFWDEGAKVYAYNANRKFEYMLGSHGYCVIGSLSDDEARMLEPALLTLIDSEHEFPSPAACLVALLANLQAIALHWPLVEAGIGGMYNGCCIQHGGIVWQPSILYVLHAGAKAMKSHFIRIQRIEGGVAIVPQSNGWLQANTFPQYLMNHQETLDDELREAIRARLEAFVARAPHEGVEWVVLLSAVAQNVVVVELGGRRRHRHIHLDAHQIEGIDQLKVGLSPTLQKWMDEESIDHTPERGFLHLMFVSYEATNDNEAPNA